jgi:sugar lactone lactonase YvrE
MIRGGTTGNSRNTVTIPPINALPASFKNPYFCVYGNVGSNLPWTSGPQTFDPQGDGCPAIVAFQGGNTASGPDVTADGLGNLFLADDPNQIMREFPVGNAFPPTPVQTASPVTQPIQVHFTYPNNPAIGATPIPDGTAMTGYTSTAFSIAPGISDFTINTTTPEFPMGMLINSGDNAYNNTTTTANFQMWAGLPTCTQLGTAPAATSPAVLDYDCLVYVTFNPTAPGIRQSQLMVNTTNAVTHANSVYYFSLSGVGLGGQLAIDGGQASPVAVTGLGKPAAVAVTSAGTIYIADPDNNRILVTPAGGGSQTTITATTGLTPAQLSGPKGVAVDSTGNVYISDTGNNRILKMDASSGAFSVLGNIVWISGSLCDGGSTSSPCPTTSGGLSAEPGANVVKTTPPAQYSFKAPQGIAVDAFNNVYVADTGNSSVVEIPSNFQLGGATPLLSYPGAPKFSSPVAIAIDSQNNVWVADNKLQGAVIVELPPGGGDLVTVPSSQFPNTKAAGLGTPNGIAVDGAGNVYVSDSGTNTVEEIPSGSGQGNSPFALNFIGLSAPAGLALDSNGNLYVADSGNKQVLVDNRQSPMVNFGNVPQGMTVPPLCANTILSDGFNVGAGGPVGCVLTITNIGSQPIALSEPLATLAGTANAAFNSPVPDSCANITGGGPLPAGITCTISPTFAPTANNGQTETLNVNGGPQTIALTANGAQPQVNIVLTSSLGTSPAAGTTTTITATVTQPHIAGNTPSGTVTFTYVIDAANKNINSCGSGGTQTVTLAGGVASFQLPTLAQGVQYTVSANYGGDSLNSQTPATPLLIAVPGVSPLAVQVTSTAAQLTFLYGGAPPTIAGTVTPTPTAPVTFSFSSAAKATTPIGSYPVVVSFSGAGACAYGFPPALFSNGSPATVTENAAPLTYTIPNFTVLYGAPNLSYGANATVTGAVNGDTVSSFTVGFAPPQSSILAVGTYSVVPTLSGGDTGDYTITAKPATLTITKAPVGLSISAAKTQVANSAAGVASAIYSISVSTAVTQGKGIPSGTVTVTDVFTPISITGLGTAQAPVTSNVALVAGFGTYTPTSIATGMHQYSFTYNGDANFQTATIAPVLTAPACTPSTPSANCLIVDIADFTLTSNTGPVIIIPGTAPSGNGLLAAPNQSTSAPETAVLFVNGILSFAGQVNLFCSPQNPSYVSCFMTPTSVTIAASGTGVTAAAVIGISTPATEPLGFNFGTTTGQLRTAASRTMLAFLPFGALAFCVRRRRRLSKALWMLMLVCAVSAGMTGCGGNQVAFYSPIPTGPQTVTVTACTASTLSACQASNFTGLSRTFVVPISID